MRRGIQKILILLAVFIVALFTFSKLTNHETKDLTTDLAAPTLPVVYFEDNGHPLNELHGYVEEMSVISMRDTITPLPENGKAAGLCGGRDGAERADRREEYLYLHLKLLPLHQGPFHHLLRKLPEYRRWPEAYFP